MVRLDAHDIVARPHANVDVLDPARRTVKIPARQHHDPIVRPALAAFESNHRRDLPTRGDVPQLQRLSGRLPGKPGPDGRPRRAARADPRARIAGSVGTAAWAVVGPAGSIRIAGEIDGWRLNVIPDEAAGRPGILARLDLGEVRSAAVTIADALGSVRALSWAEGALNANTIGASRIA